MRRASGGGDAAQRSRARGRAPPAHRPLLRPGRLDGALGEPRPPRTSATWCAATRRGPPRRCRASAATLRSTWATASSSTSAGRGRSTTRPSAACGRVSRWSRRGPPIRRSICPAAPHPWPRPSPIPTKSRKGPGLRSERLSAGRQHPATSGGRVRGRGARGERPTRREIRPTRPRTNGLAAAPPRPRLNPPPTVLVDPGPTGIWHHRSFSDPRGPLNRLCADAGSVLSERHSRDSNMSSPLRGRLGSGVGALLTPRLKCVPAAAHAVVGCP